MKIGLLAVDSKYPNLAIMKLSAYHKSIGDTVEWLSPLERYDIAYLAKVFSFTPDNPYIIQDDEVHKGGTGYDITTRLPGYIDRIQPDYSIYPDIPKDKAYGFLTRGCPNRCKWCVVPEKEGRLSPYMDVEEIAIDGRYKLILMDNNILASDYGLGQIEKIIRLNELRKMKREPMIQVDFNQALDARLVTDDIAGMLARLKWIDYIRFGCDTPAQISHCDKACSLLDKHGYKGFFFLYCILLDDFRKSFERVNYWKRKEGYRYRPYCQPFRDIHGKNVIPQWQKDMAQWANRKWYFTSCEFKDFEVRKGFKCGEYFDGKGI